MDAFPAELLAVNTPRASMLAVGCLVAGGLLTALGAWQRSVVVRLVADGVRTKATAVDDTRHHHQTTVLPVGGHTVWEFRTAEGSVHHHEDLGGGLQASKPGDTARLIYDPDDPTNARLETFAERTLAWAMFFFSGLALLAVSAISFVYWAF